MTKSADRKSPARALADSRHAPAMLVLDQEYLRWNGIPLPSPARIAAALKRFLVENPSYNSEQIGIGIHNRFASDLNPADEPWVWLPYLARYMRTPLDRFGKPKRGVRDQTEGETIDRKIEEFNATWEREKRERKR